MRFVNINTGAVTVTPATFAQGTSFTLQSKAAVDAVYNATTAASATPWLVSDWSRFRWWSRQSSNHSII